MARLRGNAGEGFEAWAIVEIVGHRVYAGVVSEFSIGNVTMIRVDVPAVGDKPGFTKIFGATAVFSIQPVTEEVAIDMCERVNPTLSLFDFSAEVQEALREYRARRAEAFRAKIEYDSEHPQGGRLRNPGVESAWVDDDDNPVDPGSQPHVEMKTVKWNNEFKFSQEQIDDTIVGRDGLPKSPINPIVERELELHDGPLTGVSRAT